MSAPVEFTFQSADGLSIACARWDAGGPARGLVQIAHGMGEHAGRYAETIAVLNAAGLTVYAGDHRGHGRTASGQGRFGDFGPGGFDLLVEDMAELSRIARTERPRQPLILLAHSMGSFAAQQYSQDHSELIDGLVLSGTGDLGSLERRARTYGAAFLNAPFQPARTPFDWLSRDDAIVDAFIADPLCFATLQPAAQASFLAAAPRLANPEALSRVRPDLPIYIMSGSEDPVGRRLCGVITLIERLLRAGVQDVVHDFYLGARHEPLNETNRAEVRSRLLAWIDAVLARRAHAAAALPPSNPAAA